MKSSIVRNIALLTVFVVFFVLAREARAATIPAIDLTIRPTDSPQEIVDSIKLLVLLTLLSLAPAFLVMMTSFTRLVIVLALLRTAIGTPMIPSAQVIVGLSLFLTIFIMAPTYQLINEEALQPYLSDQITQAEAQEIASGHLKAFMLRQTRESDLALFVNLANMERPASAEDVPLHVVVPSFVISELKTAFEIGFLLFVPFLVIDMVVASILMAMGMFMLPPIMIALPFKLLLFVMVDGWSLVVRSLVESFR